MPIEDSVLAIFIPLSFLVILRLTDVAREINLNQVYGTTAWDYFGSISTYAHIFPPFGRFTFLHGSIYVILTGLFFGVASEGQEGATKYISLFAIFFLWILYPVLEVGEYDRIAERQDRMKWPVSFDHHYWTVVINSILVLLHTYVLPKIQEITNQNTIVYWIFTAILAYLVGRYVARGIIGFLNAIEMEMGKDRKEPVWYLN